MIKQFLTKNQVYFETLIPSLLSVTALVVSVITYSVINTQTEVAKIALAPSFYISETYIYDYTRNIAYETEMMIYNDGSHLQEYDETIRSFIELEFAANNERKTIYIPIIGYYDSFFKTNKTTGKLTTVKGENNNYLYSNLYRAVLTNNFRDKYGSVFVQLKHFIRLSYTDKMGNKATEYFIDDTRSDADEIDIMLKNWAQTLANGKVYRISEMSIQDIENIIIEY